MRLKISPNVKSNLILLTSSFHIPQITISSELHNYLPFRKLIFYVLIRRRPAWTDRVLYRTFNNSKSSDHLVKCKSYESYSNVEVSDHKPVSAHFDIQVKGGALPKVEFEAINSWSVGEVGKIVYRLPNNIPLSSWHWIAFYQVRYFILSTSLKLKRIKYIAGLIISFMRVARLSP
jgi:hypothetical protein